MERRRPLFPRPAPRAWYSLALALLLPLALTAGEALSITASALSDGRALLVIEGSPRMLRAGQTSPEGVTLISASAREAVVEVGGVRRTLAPGRETSGGFATPARKRVAIQRGGQHEYLVTGTVNGLQLQFLVDTGANVVAMNAAEARRLGIDYRLNGTPAAVQTAGGVVKAWSVMLDRVEVAGIAVRHVDATVLEGEYPVRALLGMSWLGRVSMREEHGVLYLEER